MAAAMATSALSAMRGLFQAGGVASSAAKRTAPSRSSPLSQAMHRGIAEAHKEVGKSNPAMTKALSAMSGAVPHVAAMAQGKGLGSTLLSAFKGARELRKATRELSKMGAEPGGHSGGKAEGGEKAGGKTPRLVFKVGEIQRSGFPETGRRKTKDGQSPARNYGIHISFGHGGNDGHDQSSGNGFRDPGGRRSGARTSDKGRQGGAKVSPGFQIIIGHQPKGGSRSGRSGNGRSREEGGGFGAQIHISFARSGGASEMAAIRIGGLSIATQGASAASHSRKRANAFDGTRTQRKHAAGGEAFSSLDSHTGSKARHRQTPASAGRHAPGFAMTIAFSGQGLSRKTHSATTARHGGRARANAF